MFFLPALHHSLVSEASTVRLPGCGVHWGRTQGGSRVTPALGRGWHQYLTEPRPISRQAGGISAVLLGRQGQMWVHGGLGWV